MTVDYIYKYALELLGKNQAGGLEDLRFAKLWNGESSSYFQDLLGRFQRNSNGKSGIQTGLIENEIILQKLAPFTKNNPAITVTTGLAPKPSDFAFRLAVRVGSVGAIKINQNQIASVEADVLGDAPSTTNGKYYYVEYENSFKMLPTATTSIVLDYISYPVDVVWGYTRDGNNRKVYSAGTSVQPVWKDAECREITERMMKKLGVPLKDGDLQNFGQSIINAGS